MKKIPTLFEREFEYNKVVHINNKPIPGMEWVMEGEGIATIKWDGACCAIIDGIFYKRFDAKHGRPIPEGAIRCEEKPDPVTGHLPCFVPCDRDKPQDKWFFAAYDNSDVQMDGTYEAIGPHFQANPYHLEKDILIPHGKDIVEVERTFEGIRAYLESHAIEGLVFWKDGKPQCKIKSKDFGINWKQKLQESDALSVNI